MRRWKRMTTRRMMILVAASALLCLGFVGHPGQPGWHVPVSGGWRVGCCRNDWRGRSLLDHGRVGAGTYQVGAWTNLRAGDVVYGLRIEDGWCTLYRGNLLPVILW